MFCVVAGILRTLLKDYGSAITFALVADSICAHIQPPTEA